MKATEAVLIYGTPLRVEVSGGSCSDPQDAAISRAAAELEARLRSSPVGGVTPLDLSGSSLTASCIAAVLSPALLAITRGEIRGRYVVGIDPAGRNGWDADAALNKQSNALGAKLACVWRGVGGPALVGAVDEQVASTYRFVLARAEGAHGVTSRVMAEEEGITIQAASNRFAKAAALGLIHPARREVVSGGGAQHLYVPVE